MVESTKEEVFEYEELLIPVRDLFEVAVALEEVKEGIFPRKAVNLSNGTRLGLWRGETAVFWELANYTAGVSINNSTDPWYFPKVGVVIKKICSFLAEYDITTRAGTLILTKRKSSYRANLMGTSMHDDLNDEVKRSALSLAMRHGAYFKEGPWWITSKMVSFYGKRVEQVHRVYLFMEVGL